jgi:predicted cupin superfamily sugar epimerase
MEGFSSVVKGIIERYQLQPHVEGGFYRQTSKHPHHCLLPWGKNSETRSIATVCKN